MGGVRFLREELLIAVGVLGAMLATYIIFLALALLLSGGSSLLVQFLTFLQILALSSTPFILY